MKKIDDDTARVSRDAIFLPLNDPTLAAPGLAAQAERDTASARIWAESKASKGYRLTELYTYHRADGGAWYWKARYDRPTEGKRILPMRRSESGGFELKEPDFHGQPKPLYNLPALLDPSRADELVWICEGEKCALALSELGCLATTSGSSSSALGADWAPVAGRKVRVFRDFDEPGKQHEAAVAAETRKHGCLVSFVDVEALNLPLKGDAVDWLRLNPGATKLDLEGLPLVEPVVTSFAHQDGRLGFDDTCVFFEKDSGNGPVREVLCRPPVRVLARTRNADGADHGRLLGWTDLDGRNHEWPCPMELLAGDGVEIRRRLLSEGVNVSTSPRSRNLFQSYIPGFPVTGTRSCVGRLGWHDDLFVTPHRVYGQAAEEVVYQSVAAAVPLLSSRGTLDHWKSEISQQAIGNSRLVFSISVALASPLLRFVGSTEGGYHLRGGSSTGKTTCLNLAGSVWGPPEFKRNWRATDNGLEGVAAAHNDLCLVLDELGQVDAKKAGEAAYLLANGQGKSRASKGGDSRPVSSWRLVFLSSGELSLADHAKEGGRRTHAGQELRLLDIQIDAGAGYGAFENLHCHAGGSDFAVALNDSCSQFYGTAGHAWLEQLVARVQELKVDVPLRLREYAGALYSGTDGQAQRAANRFAIVAVAGELATEFGLTGWLPGEALRAVKSCFESWLARFGDGDREKQRFFDQLRAKIETQAARFEAWEGSLLAPPRDRLGFRRDEQIYFHKAGFDEACAGFDRTQACVWLREIGATQKGDDGRWQHQVYRSHDSTRDRYYVIKLTALSAAEEPTVPPESTPPPTPPPYSGELFPRDRPTA